MLRRAGAQRVVLATAFTTIMLAITVLAMTSLGSARARRAAADEPTGAPAPPAA